MDDYVTEQVFYTSADGTKIPMFITYKGLTAEHQSPSTVTEASTCRSIRLLGSASVLA